MMSRAMHQLNNLRIAASVRLAAIGAPRSMTRVDKVAQECLINVALWDPALQLFCCVLPVNCLARHESAPQRDDRGRGRVQDKIKLAFECRKSGALLVKILMPVVHAPHSRQQMTKHQLGDI